MRPKSDADKTKPDATRHQQLSTIALAAALLAGLVVVGSLVNLRVVFVNASPVTGTSSTRIRGLHLGSSSIALLSV